METTSSFGYWVRRQRKALDLTQQELADRVACSLAAIKKIETDQRRPSRQIAERLADSLGVRVEQRGIFVECARGLRPVDHLSLTQGPVGAPLQMKPNRQGNNLPLQLSSFIGRARELEEVGELLSTTRLLTLTGPGGTGKTRLSLQIAQDVLREFVDGVWLVELAPLVDPSLIPRAIASVFRLQESPRTSIQQALANYLQNRQLLLILDNCEHLVAGCAKLTAELLQVCPRIKIIASSREALGTAGETVYHVPSLSLPDPARTTAEELMESEAGQLFLERARAMESHFALQDSNVFAVIQICNRLDGIPLALELAAARVAVFSPQEIASRLDDRFRLLTGGSRTALERHQTLRALIDWSYDLLTDEEQRLFRQLSVFAGGWTFQAAESVCADLDVLSLLPRLVSKSLVMVEEHAEGTRYRLPETIRQYARDRLFEAGEAEGMRGLHLDFYLKLADKANPKLRSGEQLDWLRRLEAEHDNCRTALAWSLESGKREDTLQLAGALYYFWLLRGYLSEGRKWVEDALTHYDDDQPEKPAAGNLPASSLARRARALYAAAWFEATTLNTKAAQARIQESLAVWRQLGDKWWIAVALELVGLWAATEGDVEEGIARLEEGVSLAREIEDPWPLAVCLVRLGDNVKVKGTDLPLARQFLEEGVAVARRAGDRSILSEGLRELGSAYYGEGNLAAAAASIQESLAEARRIGSFLHTALALFELVSISCLQNDMKGAKRYSFELLTLGRETGAQMGSVLALLAFGLAACFAGEAEKGARLLAATETLLSRLGANLTGTQSPLVMVYKQAVQKAQASVGPAGFESAWTEGRQLTLEQALALATEGERI